MEPLSQPQQQTIQEKQAEPAKAAEKEAIVKSKEAEPKPWWEVVSVETKPTMESSHAPIRVEQARIEETKSAPAERIVNSPWWTKPDVRNQNGNETRPLDIPTPSREPARDFTVTPLITTEKPPTIEARPEPLRVEDKPQSIGQERFNAPDLSPTRIENAPEKTYQPSRVTQTKADEVIIVPPSQPRIIPDTLNAPPSFGIIEVGGGTRIPNIDLSQISGPRPGATIKSSRCGGCSGGNCANCSMGGGARMGMTNQYQKVA
jgi:hypothetical protein